MTDSASCLPYPAETPSTNLKFIMPQIRHETTPIK